MLGRREKGTKKNHFWNVFGLHTVRTILSEWRVEGPVNDGLNSGRKSATFLICRTFPDES